MYTQLPLAQRSYYDMMSGFFARQGLERRSPLPIAHSSWRALAIQYVLPLWFWAWAMFFAWTGVCAIVNFSWRQLMSDEFVNYQDFLQLPFPQNVLQSGNGHRPIFPNLVIVAELAWFRGNHWLQFAVGLVCAVATSAMIAIAALRERQLTRTTRAAAILLGVLGVLWLANGRMLFHSYESVHVYLLTLSVSIAGLCTFESARRKSMPWLAFACMACVVAMFCFGSGVATFPAVLVLAFAMRLPWRWYALPVGTLAFCLFLYLYALPGNQGVREILAFQPVDSVLVAVDWLSSPWVRGWLGFADPPLDPTTIPGLPYQHFGTQLQASANWLTHSSGLSWRILARLISLIGIGLFALTLARLALNQHERPTRLQALASILCLFALATSAVIGIGRLGYFHIYPEQVYADRYLVWPSLFWTGLVILLIAGTRRPVDRKVAVTCLAACAILPIALLPTQESSAIWGSIVYRNAQQIAASARTGVLDPAVFPDGDDARTADVQRSLALLKQQHQAMFAEPVFELVGTTWTGSLARLEQINGDANLYNVFDDPSTGIHVAHFEGVITRGIGQIRHSGYLAVLDSDNRIVGLADFSYITPPTTLLMHIPRKRGFDGYIRDYKPDAHYRLILLPRAGTQAVDICEIRSEPH